MAALEAEAVLVRGKKVDPGQYLEAGRLRFLDRGQVSFQASSRFRGAGFHHLGFLVLVGRHHPECSRALSGIP